MNGILSRIRELHSGLPPKANQIVALILGQAENVIHMSITEVAETCSVSEGTIVAFCRRVGARGFQELKILLVRDLIESVRLIQEDLHRGDDPVMVTDHIFGAHAASLSETRRLLSMEALAKAVALVKGAKRRDLRDRQLGADRTGSLLPAAAVGALRDRRSRFARPSCERGDGGLNESFLVHRRLGKAHPEVLAVVVVADQEAGRQRKGVQRLAWRSVGGGLAGMREVAGDDDKVRVGVTARDFGKAETQPFAGIGPRLRRAERTLCEANPSDLTAHKLRPVAEVELARVTPRSFSQRLVAQACCEGRSDDLSMPAWTAESLTEARGILIAALDCFD